MGVASMARVWVERLREEYIFFSADCEKYIFFLLDLYRNRAVSFKVMEGTSRHRNKTMLKVTCKSGGVFRFALFLWNKAR
jgi:hypothetical protein